MAFTCYDILIVNSLIPFTMALLLRDLSQKLKDMYCIPHLDILKHG